MKPADQAVVEAMGSRFAEIQKLAAMAKEQPATLRYAEGQIAKILETMTPAERLALRKALAESRKS